MQMEIFTEKFERKYHPEAYWPILEMIIDDGR